MNGPVTSSRLDLSAFAEQSFAVLGLGVSGLSAATALRSAGARVLAWDDNDDRRAAARARGIEPADLNAQDLTNVSALVLSPGIPHGHPHSHPMIERARAAGCEILCDLELLTRAEPNARYVGITGTNGKSTTTALIGHVLSELGIASAIGGNIGAPGLTLPPMGRSGVYVIEFSSYQLELLPRAVIDVAILLNITLDHLDRHGGIDGYIAAKRRIFDGQRAGQTAILGVDDDNCRAIFDDLSQSGAADVIAISTREARPGGIYIADGWLIDDRAGKAGRMLELASLETLPGLHNAQNVASTFAACSAIAGESVQAARIVDAIRTFPGLAHRQELVGYRGDVRFVNDSKATNAEAVAHALAAYDNIYWIAGGIAKEGGIATLASLFERVRHTFLIGEAADDFADTIRDAISMTCSGDLKTAIADAVAQIERDGADSAIVLLSPACASFDQFRSFEARGDVFRETVRKLDGFMPAERRGVA